jgi:hypothetical protein
MRGVTTLSLLVDAPQNDGWPLMEQLSSLTNLKLWAVTTAPDRFPDSM